MKKEFVIEWDLWSDISSSQSKKLKKLDGEAKEEKTDRLRFISLN